MKLTVVGLAAALVIGLWQVALAAQPTDRTATKTSPGKADPTPGTAAGRAGELTSGQWREDLAFLTSELPDRYGGDLPAIHWDEFRRASAQLAGRLPSLSTGEVIAGLMRLVAMQDDGSTLIWPFQPAIGMTILPVQAYWFDDGVYVTRADEEYGYTVGSRIARIGGHEIDAVFDSITPLIGAENDLHKKLWFFVHGFCPELLRSLGIGERNDAALFTLVDSRGKTYDVEINAVPFVVYAKRFFTTPVEKQFSPVVTNRRRRNYWWELTPDSRTLYIQFNEIRDQRGGEPIESFIARLVSFADTAQFDRTVVDLRRRGGGSGHLAVPVADALGKHHKINRRDRLFALIGRSTSGTVLELASMLEYRTGTLFVGEPTGEGPNGVGDSQTFKLPNSGIEVYYTDRFWPTSIPEDDRRWIEPDVRAGYKHLDFVEGRDPAMTAVLSYHPRPIDEQTLDHDTAQRLTGRYLFSPYQILKIEYKPERIALSMTLTDFIETSFFKVRSPMYWSGGTRFEIDVEGVTIDAALARGRPVEQLFIDWKGHSKTIRRVPDDFRLPVELIREDRIDAGVTALLADGENRSYYQMTVGWLLNDEGERLLEEGRSDHAIRVFQANTELYPEDTGAWESLAEAGILAGDARLAARCYRRILELDPDNKTAAERLGRLESPSKK
jgi:hypothetical protein